MKIALIGYGKMGHAIEEICRKKKHEVVLRVSIDNTEDLEKVVNADVAIEFTQPESAVHNISFCLKNNIPVVSGTTGWLKDYPEIEELCKRENGSFLYASNFSIGVNIFFELNRQLARLMAGREEYDVSLTEVHHIHKKDAPSGTAISLAEDIIRSGKKKSWILGKTGSDSELVIDSIRQGEVPGTHSIVYASENDKIEITHTAHSRMGFAAGAVMAAEYIENRKGIFTMKDVLGIGG